MNVEKPPEDFSVFEALRDTIYSEVATLIANNENRPHFLVSQSVLNYCNSVALCSLFHHLRALLVQCAWKYMYIAHYLTASCEHVKHRTS